MQNDAYGFLQICNEALDDHIKDGNISLFGTKLYIHETSKYYVIRGNDFTPQFPKGYIFAKVDKEGNIFSKSGKTSQGSIHSQYYGAECVDYYGVIVNNNKKADRLLKLSSQ